MLKVPSEALPMQEGDSSTCMPHAKSVLYRENANTVCLRLSSRKNMPRGCVLKRYCTCSEHCPDAMCPVHELWNRFFAELEAGDAPWASFSADHVTTKLRDTLAGLRVENAERFGTHDFRRGHAKARHSVLVFFCMPSLAPSVCRTCKSQECH